MSPLSVFRKSSPEMVRSGDKCTSDVRPLGCVVPTIVTSSSTVAGSFVEEVDAIPVSQLPAEVAAYVKAHYNGAKIKEAGKVTDASGKHFFEAEIKGKDLIFDEGGKFVKVD